VSPIIKMIGSAMRRTDDKLKLKDFKKILILSLIFYLFN